MKLSLLLGSLHETKRLSTIEVMEKLFKLKRMIKLKLSEFKSL